MDSPPSGTLPRAVPAKKRTTGPPDFVGVGAQRSGTTWWFRMLLEHPSIRPARNRRKELHFFGWYGSRPMPPERVAEYHEMFPRKPGQIAGEWTPRYMVDPWSPRALRQAAPDAKILILLRDPIERFRSGTPHRMSRSPNGRHEVGAVDAIERSRYAWQVRNVLGLFEREQILILQYERCRQDAVEQYRRTLRFLGVDEDFLPEDVARPRGSTQASHKLELWPDMEAALKATFEPDVAELATLVPEIDLALWPNFAHLAQGAGTSAG